MRLMLIQPGMGTRQRGGFVDKTALEPLQLGILGGMTPRNIQLELYDDRLESMPYGISAELVVIWVETLTARRAYEISGGFRRRGNKVLLCGPHVTFLPQEAEDYADSLICGEASSQWKQMLSDLSKGKLKPMYNGDGEKPLQKGILPRREIYGRKKYLPITPVQFGAGCKHRCIHCTAGSSQYRCRDAADVVKELRAQKRKRILFVDDNIVADREKAKELFRQLIPLKLRWFARCSIDVVEDEELLKLMVKSGCFGLNIGFDSIRPDSLRELNKRVNLKHVEHWYQNGVRKLREKGLLIWGDFTLGQDADTVGSIRATCQIAKEYKLGFARFRVLRPCPGTELYRRLQEEGRLLYDGTWWLHSQYRYHYATVAPEKMTAAELTEVVSHCTREFHSFEFMVSRFFANMRKPAAAFAYLRFAGLLRKTVLSRQDMTFGCIEKDRARRKK